MALHVACLSGLSESKLFAHILGIKVPYGISYLVPPGWAPKTANSLTNRYWKVSAIIVWQITV